MVSRIALIGELPEIFASIIAISEGNRPVNVQSAARHSAMLRYMICRTFRMSCYVFRIISLASIALTVLLTVLLTSVPLVAQANTADTVDPSINPGDDFYQYANRPWLKSVTIAPEKSSYDNRAMIAGKTSQRVRALIQDASAAHAPHGTPTQKVGEYYASFMDEAIIESNGLKPLSGQLTKISSIHDTASLSAYLGTTLTFEVDGLTANADHIFALWINQGFENTDHNVVHFQQGGLGLPDRDNYLDPSPKMSEQREKYQAHIAAVLKLIAVDIPDGKAAQILSLETKIAQAFAPDSEAADVFKQNNPWKRADFSTKAPGIDWSAYFKSAGLSQQDDFTVWQPQAVTGISALVKNENLEVWKDYLKLHLIDHYAAVLPKAIREEHSAFYDAALSGATSPPDRATAAIAATNGALPQAVGQLYTQKYFPPEAKAQAQAMAANLLTAFRARISNLTWMSPETKQKALAKLSAFEIGIGYPDQWIDYSTLDILPGDALGNMRRAEAFLHARNLAKLQQPVDPIEWLVNPQIPGALILFSPNAEFFSAAILQPPYFDPQGDAASNYGSAGAGMAHEISHSFDELGNLYDAHGRLGDWWTAADHAAYQSAAAKLIAQFNAYCPLPDLCVNGKEVLTEIVADQAGLEVAHDAYIASLKSQDGQGKSDVVIDGLTGEQRFFLAFSRRWRKIQTEASLRTQLKSDTHPPGEFRSDAVRNIDAWYEAFGIKPGGKLYLKPEDRAKIW